AALTITSSENGEAGADATRVTHVDEAGREEAAREMEAAIASCKLRVSKEEALLASGETLKGDKSKITRASIDDVKQMISEMEQRVSLLRLVPTVFFVHR